MGAGVFDTLAVRESCWQTCDVDYGKYPVDMDSVPVYRDSDTRAAFYELAAFYGCVDECEHEYEVKRIAIVVPVVVIGNVTLQCG